MEIYLAAAYQRKLEMREVRTALESWGHRVTATWIDDEDSAEGMSAPHLQLAEGVNRGQAMAWRDIRDLQAASMVISFTEGRSTRGSRHVEFGMAYAWEKRLIVVGLREHVFHALPAVAHYLTWADLSREMATWCVDLRPRGRRA